MLLNQLFWLLRVFIVIYIIILPTAVLDNIQFKKVCSLFLFDLILLVVLYPQDHQSTMYDTGAAHATDNTFPEKRSRLINQEVQ